MGVPGNADRLVGTDQGAFAKIANPGISLILHIFVLNIISAVLPRRHRPRRWLQAVITGFAVANFAAVMPAWLPREAMPAADGPRLRVLSLNVHVVNPRFVEMEKAILAADADVVLLMEVNAACRDAQLREVATLVAQEPGEVLLAGDLNCTPWSPHFRRLLTTTGLRDSRRGFGLQASWPTIFPGLCRIPIDHVLHSPGLAVVSRSLGPDIGSDHLPVICELAPAAQISNREPSFAKGFGGQAVNQPTLEPVPGVSGASASSGTPSWLRAGAGGWRPW